MSVNWQRVILALTRATYERRMRWTLSDCPGAYVASTTVRSFVFRSEGEASLSINDRYGRVICLTHPARGELTWLWEAIKFYARDDELPFFDDVVADIESMDAQ